ncbi:secreted protein [Grosmannia clavigera kw1407]|uniref:Secreted protein n=1 Tax=Grosmannia clavigera (strain kw1407 / UAMH 11150) TaxID=655863 RepID=F0XKG9_GROCL|nr:uncharacterized protein CMQ_8238 [Grosmannia clavigera kw1407]EFX01772.1 secreted protein [Grosmannia clavigera kw1407]
MDHTYSRSHRENTIRETKRLITSGRATSAASGRGLQNWPCSGIGRLTFVVSIFLIYLFYGDIVRDRIASSKASHGPKDSITKSPLSGFESPSNAFRPRFRYWIPDAHVNTSRVAADIAEAGARGAAGVEVLGFYLYGGATGEYVPVDWNEYGWGTPAWKRVLDAAIQAHLDNGLLMDFAVGPNQGQGVPAEEDDEGLMWDLSPFAADVPLGGSFDDEIPGWGTGTLEAVVTGTIMETTHKPRGHQTNTLSTSSLQDVTSQVSDDGHLHLDFSDSAASMATSAGLRHVVYAVYLVRSGTRNQLPPGKLTGPQTNPTDYLHNGSWVVDHFSARGARVITQFWEKHLLVNGTKEQLQQVARYAWEDSVEIDPRIYWTPDLPIAFRQRRGYSIVPFFPILFHGNSLTEHFESWFVTDEEDAGQSHVADYRTTLTEGYMEYLEALDRWANESLGIQWSSQVGYNMAVDMQTAIPKIAVPECEDLAFDESIDGYRQFSAPANMAGKPVISAEVGAVLGQAYQLKLPKLLTLIKRLYAGGVNSIMLHGLSYSGEYPNTTWPGYAAFTYAWSDMHGRHQPAWDFFRGAALDYLARNNIFLQAGVAKTDLAFYQKRTTYAEIPSSYESDDLSSKGYTYGYLNPENLALPEAAVGNGVLAPMRQAYRALIVRCDDLMTVTAAEMIAKAALAGLPVIFYGGFPSTMASYDPAGSLYVNSTLASIRNLSNVHEVPEELGQPSLASVVESLGIQPRARVEADAPWWPVWRETTDGLEQYVFVYNSGEHNSAGNITFQTTGKPYRYDPWSGAKRPVLNYTCTNNDTTLTIFFQLAPDQTMLVVFDNDSDETTIASYHVTSTSDGVLDILEASSGSGLEAHVGHTGRTSADWVATSDGEVHQMSPTSAKPFELQCWNLTAEHWDPPTPLVDVVTTATKHNTTHQLDELTSWQRIDGLHNVSGLGYYTAAWEWPPADDDDTSVSGALLSFGAVDHTLAVRVNGHTVPALDAADATLDVTPYLVTGSNKVEAVVSTTLANVMASIWDELLSSGAPPTGLFGSDTRPPGDADYGLLGPVVVTPYRTVLI